MGESNGDSMNVKYRHEFKYMINLLQQEELKNRLSAVMEYDSHLPESGFYRIRSLYFDDYDNSCYYDNENGTDPREKFRVRIYNGSSDFIRLECKRKQSGKALKTSSRITEEECRMLMAGEVLLPPDDDDPVRWKFYLRQTEHLLRPVIIIEYDRIPYICQEGNVRVTFDMNLCSSNRIDQFLDPDITRNPVSATGMNLLEVKYDEFLPDPIYQSIQSRGLQTTAFSKYYLCRRYNR